MEKNINLIVGEDENNLRLDVFINKRENLISRSRIKNLILKEKLKINDSKKCSVCDDFFKKNINKIIDSSVKKLKNIEFSTFLVGSIPTNEMKLNEEKLWENFGVNNVELIKAEINREVGKGIENITNKEFYSKNPDVILLINLKRNEIQTQIKSIFIKSGYKKLVRGIPQTRWICLECNGKGCLRCKGVGKMYKTSVHEIIGKPICKYSNGKDHVFHGSGREDIDARCLDYRPFVIEILKPLKRNIDLKKLEKQINKSSKVKVNWLKFTDKDYVRKIKQATNDKTYSADVIFTNNINNKFLPFIKKLNKSIINQKTPTRVKHRRADLLRKRGVKSISYKILGKNKLRIKIKGQAGLYIKELINGDNGRTKPSIQELLNNNVEKIILDVIKIHKVK